MILFGGFSPLRVNRNVRKMPNGLRGNIQWSFFISLLLWSFQEMLAESAPVRFLRQPSNETVFAGTRQIVIQCHIENYQNTVTWTKDGFAIFGIDGYSPINRYSLQHTNTIGEQNLRIENVTIDDDGVYECQDPLDKVRSRKAYINVQVPPKRLVISPVDQQDRITVRENQPVSIQCRAVESKPPARITWKVGENDVFRPVVDNKIPGSKLTTSVSTLSFTPARSHNGSTVQCLASHPVSQSPIVTTAVFNVLYPPGNPTLSDFAADRLIAGRNLSVQCISFGGNPLAEISWKVGDRDVLGELTTSDDRAVSALRYRLQPEDDGKMVTCSVNSPALNSAMTTQTRIQVLYSPSDIVVSQHPQDGVFENTSVSLTCRTAQSNPRATLSWYRDGLPLTPDSGDVIVTTLDLSSHSQSTLMITRVTRRDADAMYSCRSMISELNYQKDTPAVVNINYPPLYVTARVFHLAEGGEQGKLYSGQTVQLKCTATGGNPAPELSWYRDGQLISSDERLVTHIDPSQVLDCKAKSITCSVIEIVLNQSDNARKFECRSNHVASNVPKRDSIVLEVLYPPASVQISQFPQILLSGQRMSLVCESSPSFPISAVTWWYNGKLIEDGAVAADVNPTVTNSNRPSSKYVGFITRSQLYLTPTSSFDQSRITCRATNEVLEKSTESDVILDIKFPPQISIKPLKFNTTVNSNNFIVQIPIRANPNKLTFRWWKYLRQSGAVSSSRDRELLSAGVSTWGRKVALPRSDRVHWTTDRNVLRILSVRNEDGGLYQVEVTNDRGSLIVNFTIDVFYPPKITQMVAPSDVRVGSDVTLLCEFEGHPLLNTEVQWTKVIPNLRRNKLEVVLSKNSTTLILRNVTSHDRGEYRCVATNGIGQAAEMGVELSVQFGAEIDRTRSSLKVARPPSSGGKMSAELVCMATGNPKVSFSWRDDDGSVIVSGVSDSLETGYVIDEASYVNDVYTSMLFVNTRVVHLDESLASTFRCVATNSLDQDEIEAKLVPRGPPDAPSDIKVINVTHDAIALSWHAGFDGGAPQTFLLQYFPASSASSDCKFDDEIGEWRQINVPHSRTSYVIDGLRHSTSYAVCMLAFNTYGSSGAIKARLVTTSRLKASPSNSGPGTHLPTNYLLIIAASCALVLVVLILLACIVVRYLRHRRVSKPKSLRTESDSLPTPNASLTSSENGDHHHSVHQTSSFMRASVDCGAADGAHRFGGSGQSLERNSMSRVAYSADGMSGARSDLSNFEARHVTYLQGRRSSRDTSVSSLLHDEASYTNEMYQRCGTMQSVPRTRYSDYLPHNLPPSSERGRFLDRCSVDMLSCAGTNQHSTPACSHSNDWDSCVRCIEERSLVQASGRCCDIIRHAGEITYPQGQRYHSMSLNPKRQASMTYNPYPPIPDNMPIDSLNDHGMQQTQTRETCQTLPSMPRSYSTSSFLNSKRRYAFDDRCYQLQPLLSPETDPSHCKTTSRQDMDALYAVNVQEAPKRHSPDIPNESGLYVLNVEECDEDQIPVNSLPLSARGGIPCVRNSWISSSSSTSDYGSQQSGLREKQNLEPVIAADTNSCTNNSELSASSTRQLVPGKMVASSAVDSISQDQVSTAVLPPISFQDSPNETTASNSQGQDEQMVFLGVDSDGTLFV